MIKKILLGLLAVLVLGAIWFLNTFNYYQSEGELRLSVLDAPVTVRRDSLDIPYIHADSLADALRAQGFIIGQDRLYQAEMYKAIANGRLSEMIGERGLTMDTLMRMVGIQQLAEEQIALLNDNARAYYENYLLGLNDYISNHREEHPFSLTMLGHTPEPWTLKDIIAVQFFQMWGSTANWKTELLAQQILDTFGPELADSFSMVSVNPDDEVLVKARLNDRLQVGLSVDPELWQALPNDLGAASNAWASSGSYSAGGKPVFSNSPHIDARVMPGFWYPMGMFTPEVRAIGAAAPGTPGFGIARTEDIVFGATNGYSDGTDLYIETLDPNKADHYLEGEKSFPLSVREETVRIKDAQAANGYREQVLRFRYTRRGPLLSDHGMALDDDRAISVRWATPGALRDSIGTDELLLAKSVDEAREAFKKTATPLSNIVVDRHGDIARIATGHVPVRTQGDGSHPAVVRDGEDNWDGNIPADEMPTEIRPERGWTGTANHRLIPHDYPYEYSTYFSPSWRYRRIVEYMEANSPMSADTHWELINDVKNPMGELLAPMFVEVLSQDKQTQVLAEALAGWDYFDTVDSQGAAVYQVMMKHALKRTYGDDMSPELFNQFIDMIYYWQERFVLMLQENNNPWFDDKRTEAVETRDDILLVAGRDALAELQNLMGNDASQWQWGKLLTITFASPVIPGETAANWLGGGVHPMFGSAESLNRGGYKFSKGYEASFIDSVRFVADMADNEKVLAVVPGGVSGRYLDPSLHNQTEAWLAGEPHYWWFSDKAIKANTVKTLVLLP